VAPVAAVQESATWVSPGVATSPVGAAGKAAAGVDVTWADAADSPALFTAVTIKKYGVPSVSPVFVYEVELIPLTLVPFAVVTPVVVE
jgi:uncharacterized protein (DUF983 family)